MEEQNPVKSTNNSIRVKRSYIYIALALRIVFSILVFSVMELVLLVLFILFSVEFSIPLPFTLMLLLSIPIAFLLSLPVAFSDRILKRFCGRWGYSRFYWVQKSAQLFALASLLCIAVFFLVTVFYKPLPLWFLFIFMGLLITLSYPIAFVDIFSLLGEAVLSFKLFMQEFEKKADYVDFGKLRLAAKSISRIAESYNMKVSSQKLALAMTLSFLSDHETARREFGVFIDWIENSTKEDNFERFRNLVREYDTTAEKSAKEGIGEKHQWASETAVKLIGAIVVPIVVAIIAHVVPKILEMLS